MRWCRSRNRAGLVHDPVGGCDVTGAEPSADSSYVIQTGVQAIGRLELIARLFWPTTESFLDRHRGFNVERFLDVGCGMGDVTTRAAQSGVDAVLGIDANAEVVTAARQRAGHAGSSARFRTATVDQLGSDAELAGFDVAFARCVLSHLADPGGAVSSMVEAVRPGGLILIEDVEVAAVWSSPPCPALARHVELYIDAATGMGGRPDIGPAIPGLFRALDVTDIEVDVAQPLLREVEDLRIHARTMEAVAGPVLDQRLASEEEVAELVDQLDEWASTPGVVATLPRIVQVSARKPR